MTHILYLDDYINLYSSKINKILVIKPYKNTLKYGRIIDREKFINKMSKELKKNKVNNTIFNNTISVITSLNYSLEDKKIIIESLEELNYRKIEFIDETKYLKMKADTLYINCSIDFIYLYLINYLGNTEVYLYDYNKVNQSLLNKIIKLLNKKEIYLYGKNYLEVVDILRKGNNLYYYFEDRDNLIIKLILQSNNKN